MTIKLVPDGIELLQNALAGQTDICFTSVQLGNGNDAGNSAESLSNPLMTLPISSIDVDDTFVTLHVAFNNGNVSAPFHATELGVRAEDPENAGATILYAYGYTEESSADYIPAWDDRMLESVLDILIYIGDAENVTAAISQSIEYVTKQEYNAYVARRDNPHGVTKEQVGLGNVPNVSTNDQTPTYEEADEPQGLVSGETLRVAMGKIKRAIASLISHIARTDNPHSVTLAQIGAAASEHKHSTADIISGQLTVERGGTGVGTEAALAALVANNLPNGAVPHDKTSGVQKQHSSIAYVTLAPGGWLNNRQEVEADGVTASNLVFTSPWVENNPGSTASTNNWLRCRDNGVRCIGQGDGTLTFECETVPDSACWIAVAIFD